MSTLVCPQACRRVLQCAKLDRLGDADRVFVGCQLVTEAYPNEVAAIHYTNRLKWLAMRQWHKAVLLGRIARSLDAAVQLKYERALARRMLAKWRERTRRRQCVRNVCLTVRRLRLSTFDAVRSHCRTVKEVGARTTLFVYAVRLGQMQLCRRVLHMWRSFVAHPAIE